MSDMTRDEITMAIQNAKRGMYDTSAVGEYMKRVIAYEASLTPEQLRRAGEELDEAAEE